MDQLPLYLNSILLAYAAFMLGMISPGPNIMAVIGTSMGVGRKQGLALALGVSTGSFCWATMTVVGLSSLLVTYASALFVIKILGGLYLLWLAYKAFREAASSHDMSAIAITNGKRGIGGYYMRGLTVQMTNPKAALSWIAIISLGLQADAPYWVGLMIVIGAGSLSVIFHSIYALAFSTKIMVRLYIGARRYLQALLGAFFTFAGIGLLINRS